jgi:uncharacterized damage-inducible protein DinB
VTVEERVSRLERTVQELIAEIERLPPDVVYQEPEAGEWPVMSTLAHLSELMPYWAHEAQQVARSPGTAFGRTHDDPRRIGAIEQHGRDALDAMVPHLQASLNECVSALRSIPADAWGTTGEHLSRGSMSVEAIVDSFIVDHAEEHSAQIASTLQALHVPSRQ